MFASKCGFRKRVDDNNAYHFEAEGVVAYSIKDLVDIVRTISEHSLRRHIMTKWLENWTVLKSASKDVGLSSLRERLESSKVKDLRQETLRVLFSWRWAFEESCHWIIEHKWERLVKLIIVLGLIVAGFVWHMTFLVVGAILLSVVDLATLVLVGYLRFDTDKELLKTGYEGVRLGMNLFVVAIGAILAIIFALQNDMVISPWVACSGAAGMLFGIWGLLLLGNVENQTETTVRISSKAWSLARFYWWIEFFAVLLLVGYIASASFCPSFCS